MWVEKKDGLWLHYACFPDLAYPFVAKLGGFNVMVTPHLGSNGRSQAIPILRACGGWLLALADRLALISRTQESRDFRTSQRCRIRDASSRWAPTAPTLSVCALARGQSRLLGTKYAAQFSLSYCRTVDRHIFGKLIAQLCRQRRRSSGFCGFGGYLQIGIPYGKQN